MTTGLFTHPACLEHVTPPGHPEQVARLRAVLSAFDHPDFAGLERSEAPLATREALLRAHSPSHVDLIAEAEIPPGKFGRIDADTAMSSGSRDAALRAAGALVAAVDA